MEADNTDKNAELPTLAVSDKKNDTPSAQGVFLPIAILMIAVLLILGWELYLTKTQGAIWQKQITQREQLVNQARAVQSDLQKIAFDLMTLSLTDPDARAIVEKYQIKQEPNKASPAPKR
jgi:hypothetical protein